MPVKEALALVILDLFQDPSCKVVTFLMGCRKDFGMTKMHQILLGKRSIGVNHPEIFSGSSSKITAFLMGCRKDFGMTKTHQFLGGKRSIAF
ncbi:MAG: hypothetical protein V5804_12625 [Mucilaginibacter sp.]|uniref:hypothetical protein n=1 Tax=Mucilaginibacter sp. TaxID=1882438 RepID=UPI0034E4A219